jgi:predicted nucleotidyltransferase
MTQNTGYLSYEDYQQLQTLLNRHFDHTEVRVLVFGSRATGHHRPDSDLDLVVMSNKGSTQQVEEFRKALQYAELRVPVEVIGYEEATPETVKRVQDEGILFWPHPSAMQVSS